MLTVTQEASARLAVMLRRSAAPHDMSIRLAFDGSGIAIRQDTEREDDLKFQHEGKSVLLLDPLVSKLLEHDTLRTEGGRLVLQTGTEKSRQS